MATSQQIILVDGSQAFDGGVDSSKAPTLASEMNPLGLARNELAWLINAHTRDSGITCRDGFDYRAVVNPGGHLVQGGYIYEPLSGFPYLVCLIGGVTYKVDLQTYVVTDLTGGDPTKLMPANSEQPYFCQGEEFLIIQAGDYTTKPLIWDNVTLRRSLGITNTAVAPGTHGVNEIPAAGPMDYYEGRLWWGSERRISAGDIVGGPSGSNVGPTFYNFRDAILNVTESPLVVGGDGFALPTNAGTIRAIKHTGNFDSTLGVSDLYIFTRRQIYALSVPITRNDWITTTTNNAPALRVIQYVNGAVNDRSVVASNSDLFFQSLEPSIRSLMLALRYSTQWGNTPVAANENRILQFNDRALLHMASGIIFNNRLYQTALPKQTTWGVVHQAIIPMDFDPISSFRKKQPPTWEGHYEGLDIFQMFAGDFGGLERAFALVLSRLDNTIQLWELTDYERFDVPAVGETRRVTWVTETPAYTFKDTLALKRLLGGEIWVDRVYGNLTVNVYYRVDADPCWVLWHTHQFCTSKSGETSPNYPIDYPEGYPIYPVYPETCGEGWRWPIVLPKPPTPNNSMGDRPTNIGFQFQLRIEVTGFARIRTILIYGATEPRSIYKDLGAQNTPPFPQAMSP